MSLPRILTSDDLSVRRSLGPVTPLSQGSAITIEGPAGFGITVATNDAPGHDYLRTIYRTHDWQTHTGNADIILRTGAERSFVADSSSGLVLLGGPCIPFTLFKQAYRWSVAQRVWRQQARFFPLHAVVLQGQRGCIALIGEPGAGKSHLASTLIDAFQELRYVTDDWGLLDAETLRHHRGSERFLHVRRKNAPIDSSCCEIFEQIDERSAPQALVEDEQRYLISTDMPVCSDHPVTDFVFLSHGVSTDHGGEHSLTIADTMVMMGDDLLDISLSGLSTGALAWFRSVASCLSAIDMRAEPAYAGTARGMDARDGRVLDLASRL